MIFRETYNECKNVFASLAELSNDEIDAIEEEGKQDDTQNKTNKHLFVITAASLTIIVLPYVIAKIYNSLGFITNYLKLKQGNYSKDFVIITNISLGVGAFSILMYLFLFPDFKVLPKSLASKSKLFSNINRKQNNYIFASIVGCYIAFGFVLFLVQLNFEKYSDYVISVFRYYLILPLSLISIFTFMVLIITIYKPFHRYIEDDHHSRNSRIELSFLLLTTLLQLKNFNNLYLMPKKSKALVTKNLNKAFWLVINFSSQISNDQPNSKLIESFRQSANFLDRLQIDFQTVNQFETINLKDRLIEFTNVVLQGNLLDLPKTTLENNNPMSIKKVKLYHYLLLAIYLTLPILVVILLGVLLKVTFTEYNQSLLKILYIIWAFVGIFSNPIILNSDNKELIQDIVKSWFGK